MRARGDAPAGPRFAGEKSARARVVEEREGPAFGSPTTSNSLRAAPFFFFRKTNSQSTLALSVSLSRGLSHLTLSLFPLITRLSHLLTLTQEEEVRLVIEECHEHWGLMQQIFEYVGRPVLFVFSLLCHISTVAKRRNGKRSCCKVCFCLYLFH